MKEELIWYGGIGHYCDRVPSRDGTHTVLVSRVDGTMFLSWDRLMTRRK